MTDWFARPTHRPPCSTAGAAWWGTGRRRPPPSAAGTGSSPAKQKRITSVITNSLGNVLCLFKGAIILCAPGRMRACEDRESITTSVDSYPFSPSSPWAHALPSRYNRWCPPCCTLYSLLCAADTATRFSRRNISAFPPRQVNSSECSHNWTPDMGHGHTNQLIELILLSLRRAVGR